MTRTYRAEVEIAAPPKRVWDVLIDLDRYGAWNPFTPKVVTDLAPGSPVEITVILGGKQVVQVEWPPVRNRRVDPL